MKLLVLECGSVIEARDVLAAHPLVKRGLISFDVIPPAPYSGLSRLLREEPE